MTVQRVESVAFWLSAERRSDLQERQRVTVRAVRSENKRHVHIAATFYTYDSFGYKYTNPYVQYYQQVAKLYV